MSPDSLSALRTKTPRGFWTPANCVQIMQHGLEVAAKHGWQSRFQIVSNGVGDVGYRVRIRHGFFDLNEQNKTRVRGSKYRAGGRITTQSRVTHEVSSRN